MFGDPQRSAIIAYTSVFIGLIAVGGWISIPFIPVPLTLQTFFVLLAGTVMKRFAFIPAALYILCGALSLPVFHNGTAGIGVLLGPTGGYIVGFVPAALVVGIAYERTGAVRRIAGLVLGTVLIYACGVAWLCLSTGIPPGMAVLFGVLPFIPGDAVKILAVYMMAGRLELRKVARSRESGGGAAG
jgi:biotin transport system substrate-specific component